MVKGLDQGAVSRQHGGMSRDLDEVDNVVQTLVLLSAPTQYFIDLRLYCFDSAQACSWNEGVRMER